MAIERLVAYLNSVIPLNRALDAAIRENTAIVHLRRGQFMALYGEKVNKVWYVGTGLAKEYYIDASGNVVITAFFKQDEIILVADSFLLNKDSERYLQVIEDSTMLSLNTKQARHLLSIFPEINLIIYAILRESNRKTAQRGKLIALRGKEGYRKFCEIFPYSRISIADAASFLGISRGALTKVRAKIKFDPGFYK